MNKLIQLLKFLFATKKRAAVIVFLIVILLVLILRNRATTSETTTQTANVSRGTLVVSLSSSGQVTALNSATVDTSSTGVISKVYVKNGEKVKAGDPIIELELDQDSKQKYMSALSSYNSAKNNLSSAQNNLNSLQASMFSSNVKFINDAVARNLSTTDPTYIQENATWIASENAYKNQQNAIRAAEQSLSASSYSLQASSPVVYAPISGTVNGLSLTVGSVLSSQSSNSNAASAQRIASVVTDANPTITLNLTQIDAPKVKVGNRATITLDAFSDKTYTGKVVSIDTVGSVSNSVTTYPTVIQLDTQNPEMYPNMSATANIILDTRDNVLIIPSTAVQSVNGQANVRVIKDGKMQTISVEVGKSNDSETEIISGLNEGDTVVTSIVSATKTTSTTNGNSVFSSLGGRTGGFSSGAVRVTNVGR